MKGNQMEGKEMAWWGIPEPKQSVPRRRDWRMEASSASREMRRSWRPWVTGWWRLCWPWFWRALPEERR